MGDLPSIRILPDQIGRLHEFRVDGNDTATEARVSWVELTHYRRGTSAEREKWLPVDQLQPLDGEDYSGVPRTPVAPEVVEVETPANWPDGVPAPGADGWERAAVSWLFEQVPSDFRAHAVLSEHPSALVWMARLHLRQVYTAVVRGYRSAAVELKRELPPHAVREVDEVYRLERERVIRCGKGVDAVGKALAET